MIDTTQYESDLITAVIGLKCPVAKALAIDSVKESSFTGSNAKRAWRAIQELTTEGNIVDFTGVAGRMGESMDLVWLAESMQNSVVYDANIKGYVTRVNQCGYLANAKRRAVEAMAVIDELTDITAVSSVADGIEAIFDGLNLDVTDSKPVLFKQVAGEYVMRMEEKANGKTDDHIVYSNIPELDVHTGGFNTTDLIVIGGMSGSGKTEMAVKIKTSIAKNNGSSLIFSLEMSNDQVVERAIGNESGLPISSLRNPGDLTDDGWSKVSIGLSNLVNQKMFLYDQTGLTVRNIMAIARAHKAKYPDLNFIVVDHVGLMELEATSGGRHDLQVGDISKKLKMLAKELKTPVCLLTQLTGKAIMQRPVKERTPVAQDIKDSSRIEEDSDLIL